MKLDKTSIFGLALAFGLLFLLLQYGAKNRQQNTATSAPSEEKSAVVQDEKKAESLATASLPENFQNEEVTLESKDAIFKFSTATGALYRTTIKSQHEYNQKDVPVNVNRFSKKSIGGLETHDGKVIDAGYTISNQTDSSITFVGTLANGLVAKKEWKLIDAEKPGSDYRMNYKVTIENPTDQVAQASEMHLFVGSATPLHKKEYPDQSGYFYLANGKYKKHKSHGKKFIVFGPEFSKNSKEVEDLTYIGVSNQFFSTIITPKEKYNTEFTAVPRTITLPEVVGGVEKTEASLSIELPEKLITNNGIELFEFDLYTGPKKYSILKNLEPNAGSAMNYGFFHLISRPLNNTLNWIHNNIFEKFAGTWAWGLSIILLTLLIRTIMWPLTRISIKSSKRMSKLQPMIKELKEKYPDDPQKVQQEQMKLFSEYGINPVAGCLPMLLQIPIFFGLFTMLKSAVEFRHEGFMWITDLTEPDRLFSIPVFGLDLPINLLPIIMLATMIIQMSMNPTPTDPMQKTIMRFMPIMMVIFCYGFASALALYWTTSNIFTIFQTWIMKVMPDPELKKKERKKGGFMERLQKQAEEMQRKNNGQPKDRSTMRDAKPKAKKKRGPKTGG